MPERRVFGCVAPLDVRDVCARIISGEGLSIEEVPIPLMSLYAAGSDHSGSKLVGLLTHLSVEDGQIEVEGMTTVLEPGCYSCGVDLADCEYEYPDDDILLTKSRLMGVTVYGPGSTATPSFPNAHIHVEEINVVT